MDFSHTSPLTTALVVAQNKAQITENNYLCCQSQSQENSIQNCKIDCIPPSSACTQHSSRSQSVKSYNTKYITVKSIMQQITNYFYLFCSYKNTTRNSGGNYKEGKRKENTFFFDPLLALIKMCNNLTLTCDVC